MSITSMGNHGVTGVSQSIRVLFVVIFSKLINILPHFLLVLKIENDIFSHHLEVFMKQCPLLIREKNIMILRGGVWV